MHQLFGRNIVLQMEESTSLPYLELCLGYYYISTSDDSNVLCHQSVFNLEISIQVLLQQDYKTIQVDNPRGIKGFS